jgi:hypothetical protein
MSVGVRNLCEFKKMLKTQANFFQKEIAATVENSQTAQVSSWLRSGREEGCRSIRNVAFWGPEDEMVIVAPSTTLEFSWGKSEQTLSIIVLARVFWRSRLDGTRG